MIGILGYTPQGIVEQLYLAGYIYDSYPEGYNLALSPIGYIIKSNTLLGKFRMYIRSPKELGIQLMNERRKLKLSQNQVAEETGLMQKTISALENHAESTQIETLFRILSALNLNLYLSPKDQKNIKQKEWKEEW